MSENCAQEAAVPPGEENLNAFWRNAVLAARFNPAEAYMGQSDLVSLRPPAFSFGDCAREADRLCSLVLWGAKTAVSGYEPVYRAENVGLPRPGQLSILCDGGGLPRALLQTREVRTVPFAQVTPEIAAAEGESDLRQWVLDHEILFRKECEELGIDFSPSAAAVIEYFAVLYTAKGNKN